MTRLRQRPPLILATVAFLAFISLGLPDGVLGVAWLYVMRSFTLDERALGALLAAGMAGYLTSSFVSGRVVSRHGVGRVLMASTALMVAASLGYALTPAWLLMVALATVAGLGAGAVDAGLNIYAAERFSPRMVNWLHACYGTGAALGPMLMTLVLALGLSWRWGYGVVAVILFAMTLCFAFTIPLWRGRPTPAEQSLGNGPSSGTPADAPGITWHVALRRPAVLAGAAMFFLYVGLEVTAGVWSYTLFTQSRGVSELVAGMWVGIYWASLTAGRIVFGAAAATASPRVLLRIGLVGAPLSASLIWLNFGNALSFVGLAGLGFCLAPIFPMLMFETPRRLGPAYAVHAVGFQVSAGALGSAGLPALAGWMARSNGLEVIGPYLVLVATTLLLLHEIVARRGAGITAEVPVPAGAPDARAA